MPEKRMLFSLKNWLALAVGVVILDQITKLLILEYMTTAKTVYVAPFFNLVLTYNPGAAFSFLAAESGWQRVFFIATALIASGVIVWLLRRHRSEPRFCFALGLVLGGAVGNLIDRLIHGAVVDFIQWHVSGYYWPAFNVADSAISVGAALLIWDCFHADREKGREKSCEKSGISQ